MKRRRSIIAGSIGLGLAVAVVVWWSVSNRSVEERQTPMIQRHAFDAPTREHLRAAFTACDAARALLAADRLDGTSAAASTIRSMLDSAPPAPPDVARWLSGGAAAARRLETATDLASARAAFAQVTLHLVALAEMDPELAAGWFIFRCPMVEGFAKWFQPTETLENPYMGLRMLECGSPSDWSVGADVHAAHAAPGEIAYYTCSMHPSVRSASPGLCPICSMTLTPVTRRDLESGAVFIDAARRQRIGVRTALTERRVMTRRIQAVGEVRADETRLVDVTLRTGGWVQNLAAAATGQRVRAGQTLFTLYSPELYGAQREHLAAVRNQAASEMFATLARGSRQRLHLLGMTEAQIDTLELRGEASEHVPILSPAAGWVLEKDVVEGARVESGARVYRIAGLDRVWIDAEVYEADLPHVHVGQRAIVVLTHVPDPKHEARIDFIYPELQAASRTARVRVVLDNPDLDFKPGMYANVELDVDLGERIAIPTAAVIYTGPRRLVFVDLGDDRFRPQEVTLGVEAGGWSEVQSGLQPGDVVVTSGNFLIAAESRIRASAGVWEAPHGNH